MGNFLGVAFYVEHYMSSQNVKSSYANIIQQQTNVTKKKTLTGVDNSKSLFVEDSLLVGQLLNQSPHASEPASYAKWNGMKRLRTYLDAVRSMDRSNAELVVKAFEELPSGYGRHLEMKLLMRSWDDLTQATFLYVNSLDAKMRKFGISRALAGWAVG